MATLRERINQGPTFGTWLAIGSSQTAETMGEVGFDWVILDTQHGGMAEADLLPIIQALNCTGTPTLVRVNWIDPALIMRAADLGADGVVIPMINTRDDAETAVSAIRYPPKGIRSFGPLRNYYTGEDREEPLCICMIETVQALQNVEEIAETPGLDGLLVGPADLALSMGLEVSMAMPAQVLEGIEKVATVCKRNGLIAASVGFGLENIEEQLRRGVTFITAGADSLFLRQGAAAEVEKLKRFEDQKMTEAPAVASGTVCEELRSIVGDKRVVIGQEIGDRYRVDIMGKYRASPAFLVKPSSTQQVSDVVRIAAAHNLSITMVGGQTGTCGGAIAKDGGIALSLERMNRIEEIDTVSMTLTVEAGCLLQGAQDAAQEQGAFLPLDLGSRGSATIGGCIAANAGGNRVLRWGMMRDMVLGLEIVLSDGTIVSALTKMLKDNAGYHWKELMIGSEGTLGIVTKAVLRLRPQPLTNQTALVALSSFDNATKLLRDLEVRLSGQLSSFELMWREFYDVMTEAQIGSRPRPMESGHPFYALVEKLGGDEEVDGEQFERTLMAQIQDGTVSDAVIAKSEKERQALWSVREDLAGGYAELQPCTVYDVSMALADMPAFVADVRRNVEATYTGARLIFYGHAGDGNLHIIVHVGKDGAAHEHDVDRIVYQTVQSVGGSIAAEHGIGVSRAPFIGLTRSEAELYLMQRLKHALDPQGLLNPGKVLAG